VNSNIQKGSIKTALYWPFPLPDILWEFWWRKTTFKRFSWLHREG